MNEVCGQHEPGSPAHVTCQREQGHPVPHRWENEFATWEWEPSASSTAPDLSPDERIVLDYYEAQPFAPESFRNVLARALFMRETRHPGEWDDLGDDTGYHEDADYILSVVRGETDGVWTRDDES